MYLILNIQIKKYKYFIQNIILIHLYFNVINLFSSVNLCKILKIYHHWHYSWIEKKITIKFNFCKVELNIDFYFFFKIKFKFRDNCLKLNYLKFWIYVKTNTIIKLGVYVYIGLENELIELKISGYSLESEKRKIC